jgi:hypothetical protein
MLEQGHNPDDFDVIEYKGAKITVTKGTMYTEEQLEELMDFIAEQKKMALN